MSEAQALEYLLQHAGKYYDKRVVATFIKTLKPEINKGSSSNSQVEKGIAANEVRPGMRLARDLVTPQGILLLAKGQAINEAIIERIHMLEKDTNTSFKIFINERE